MRMNRIVIGVAFAAGLAWPLQGALAQPAKASADTAAQRAELSYALGYEAGLDLGQRHLNIEIANVLRGVQDGYSRRKPVYSPQVMQRVVQAMERQMAARARAAYLKLAADNLQKAQAFFAANAKRAGVKTLASGVQYKVLAGNGSGARPTIHSDVKLQFRAQFLDGTVFQNTEDNGKPVVFPVAGMIPGWRDVITRMQPGDHWEVFIPPSQAYGIRGDLPRIGPNEALIFDIHLLDVEH